MTTTETKPAEYLCSECGKGAVFFDKPCIFCGSVRIVTVKFAVEHFGIEYYKNFDHGEPPTIPVNSDNVLTAKQHRKQEIEAVKQLGSQIGYGNLMNLASALWALHLESLNLPRAGAFVPCLLNDLREEHINPAASDQYRRTLEVSES